MTKILHGIGLVQLFWAPAAVWAQDYPALHAVVGVALDDVLNIRAAPDAGSPIVGTIPPDAMGIEVVAVQEGWAVVNTAEATGYVAMRFLSPEEAPAWNSLQTRLSCLGTEPFWSLHIDPGAGMAQFSTPDDPEGQALPIGQTWPGQPWAPAAAIALPEGLAVMAPEQCSDGMSDRSYGLRIDLFLTNPDTPRYSGCCMLAGP